MIKTTRTTRERNITYLLLSFFPLTGIFGLHDFYLQRKKPAIGHLIIIISYIAIWALAGIMYFSIPDYAYGYFKLIGVFFAIEVGTALLIISYLWSIIEGVVFMNEAHQKSGQKSQTTTNRKIAPYLTVIIPYMLILLYYHVFISQTGSRDCFIISCYSNTTPYAFGSIIMVMCAMIGALISSNKRSSDFIFCIVVLSISFVNVITSLLTNTNILFP